MKIQKGVVAALVGAALVLVAMCTGLLHAPDRSVPVRDKIVWALALFGYAVIGSAVAAWGGFRVGHAGSRSESFALMAAGAAFLAFWFAIV